MTTNNAADSTLSGGYDISLNPSPITGTGTISVNALGMQARQSCFLATTGANLTATYSNGSSGVGATLTNSGTQVAFSLDGVGVSVGDRVLIKDQSPNQFQNGIYTITTVGSGSTNWVLTRATDFDGSASGSLNVGAEVGIQLGTLNAGTTWMQSDPNNPIVIGTTPITFQQTFPILGGTTNQITVTNTSYKAPVISMPSDVIITTSVKAGNLKLGNSNSLISTDTNGNIVLDPNGTGWVEIDFSGSKTGLQFNNQIQNRVITLYEATNNEHQYYGFGVNSNVLRYQVDQTSSAHVFYAATSSSASNEVFRIQGNGDIVVGGGTSGRFFPNRMPSGWMYMEANGTATTITTAGTFYKIGGTTTSGSLDSFTMPANNKLLYSGALNITAVVQATASIITNQAAGLRATIAIFKNGTRITGTNAAADIASSMTGSYQSITTNTLVSLSTNDYIEIWITGSAGVGTVTLTATNMQVTIGTT